MSKLHRLPNYEDKEDCLSFIEEWKDDLKVLLFFRQDLAEEFKNRFASGHIGYGCLPLFVSKEQLKEVSEVLTKCSEEIERLRNND